MNEPKRWGAKDPADIVDYAIDWTDVLDDLGGDTIATVAWTVPAGLTGGAQAGSGSVRTIVLSGGIVGIGYSIASTITTAGGRTVRRRVLLDVLER